MESTNAILIGYDTTFELNEFNQPRIRSEIEIVKDTIMFVLFAKMGQYPSLPMIGLDIKNMLYSFYDEIDENELKDQLINQCEVLGVYFNSGNIGLKKVMYRNQPSLLIHIEGKEVYPYNYLRDSINRTDRYLIGITVDEMNRLLTSISINGG